MPTESATHAALKLDYLERVRAFAERLRPRFETDELHGWREEDVENTPGDWSAAADAMARTPMGQLESLARSEMVRSRVEAYLVLACSPSETTVDLADLPVEFAAVTCVVRDVLCLARSRGWYKPTPNESPRQSELPNPKTLTT